MTREEAIKILKEYAPRIKPFYEPQRTEYKQAVDMAIEALQFAKHFDLLKEYQSLQEVVRCKDCRYYNPIDENKPYPCGYGMYMCNKDDFCSYGERREP